VFVCGPLWAPAYEPCEAGLTGCRRVTWSVVQLVGLHHQDYRQQLCRDCASVRAPWLKLAVGIVRADKDGLAFLFWGLDQERVFTCRDLAHVREHAGVLKFTMHEGFLDRGVSGTAEAFCVQGA
jgi:hypothetical protein